MPEKPVLPVGGSTFINILERIAPAICLSGGGIHINKVELREAVVDEGSTLIRD